MTKAPEFRVGIGTDLHRFSPDRPLVLGGVEIPGAPGLLGHSDGDALLHALCDACLGAAGREDIGTLFPDTDPATKGLDSREIAARVRRILEEEGWTLVNLDAVVECESPKLAPWRERIRDGLASAFGISPSRVHLKGKTAEGLGPVGRREALRVTAVALAVRTGGWEEEEGVRRETPG